ncbi:MAG: TetR/AcrR family transcriptional regulator [Lachnospiraceae bacterium]|nr:TetR/AcrR family transcriptional regulator [Lachnospiraceae bacterium]
MQIKKEEVREKILAVSESLFIRYGYTKTSLNMIAGKCYISKSNIYRYFASKEEIYRNLVENARCGLLEVTDRLTAPDFVRKSLKEKIEEISALLIDVIVGERRGLLVLLNGGRQEDRDFLAKHFVDLFTERARTDNNEFKTMIAKMLIFGLTDIVTSYEDTEDLKERIIMLMKYHYLGFHALVRGIIDNE